jgi:hypothetical protein
MHQAGDVVKQTMLTPVKQVGGIMPGSARRFRCCCKVGASRPTIQQTDYCMGRITGQPAKSEALLGDYERPSTVLAFMGAPINTNSGAAAWIPNSRANVLLRFSSPQRKR